MRNIAEQKGPRKRSSTKGFTLMEIMVTVAVLSFGIVSIYEAFFISVDTYGYYTRYLNVRDWVDGKITELELALLESQVLEQGRTAGQITRGHKTFDWTVQVTLIGEDQGLYAVDVRIFWREGVRTVDISRTAYLMPPQLRLYNEKSPV
jgi:prepilin-type N-terminal cleavage/methylation domain-containing protein